MIISKNEDYFHMIKDFSNSLKPYGNKLTGKESNIKDIRLGFSLILDELANVKNGTEDFIEKMKIEDNYNYGKLLFRDLESNPVYLNVFTLLDFVLENWFILEDFWVTFGFINDLIKAVEENL